LDDVRLILKTVLHHFEKVTNFILTLVIN